MKVDRALRSVGGKVGGDIVDAERHRIFPLQASCQSLGPERASKKPTRLLPWVGLDVRDVFLIVSIRSDSPLQGHSNSSHSSSKE
jgi:hypothetical protein